MSDPNWIPVCRLDYELTEQGAWPAPLRAKLQAWANVGDFQERRKLSSSLVPEIISILLGDDLTEEGRKRAKLLGEQLVHFEDLIITTKTGLRRKFYRDHLNHMVRVCLLAKAFGEKLNFADMSANRKRLLALVGLMHDVAYPLAEARDILHTTVRSMERSYETISFTDSSPNYKIGLLLARLRRIAPSRTWEDTFASYLESSEHFIMGAIEFLGYVDEKVSGIKGNDFTLAAQAIAFHDNQVEAELRYSDNPILTQLILCDELQEWGRPAEFQQVPVSPVIPELLDFRLERTRISCQIDFGSIGHRLGRPLTQTWAKWKNVSRIIFDRRFPEIDILVNLPGYTQINLSRVEGVLHTFFRSRRMWRVVSISKFRAFLEGLDRTGGFPFTTGNYLDRTVLRQNVTRFLPILRSASSPGTRMTRISDLFLRYVAKPVPRPSPQLTLNLDLNRFEGLTVVGQGIPKAIRFSKSSIQSRINLQLLFEDPPGTTKRTKGTIVRQSRFYPSRLATIIGGIGAAMVIGDLMNNHELQRRIGRTSPLSLRRGGIAYTPAFDAQTMTELLGVTRVEAETIGTFWENRRLVVDANFFRWDSP